MKEFMQTHAPWLKAAGVRAIKTFAQTAAATISTAALLGEVNWGATLSASVLAALLSMLTHYITIMPLCQPFYENFYIFY